MSASVEWGSVIKVDGVRPAWLRGRVLCDLKTASGWTNQFLTEPAISIAEDWAWKHANGDVCITHIRLPADHIAYRAIAAGFEPWGGGDSAPVDWDGNAYCVLYRDGQVIGRRAQRWNYYNTPQDSDIIGYRRKSVAVEAVDTVTIARRTTEGWAKDYAYRGIGEFLKDHGLIIPTQAERIADATSISVADVERVIAAIGECGA